MDKIDVFLVDDHVMLREALAKTLKLSGRVRIVGQASDGMQCLAALEECAPHVVLMDLQMPGIDGIALCQRVLSLYPRIRVVMLTMREEPECAAQALRVGAVGYLLKNESFTDALGAIEAAHAGRRYLSARVRSALIDEAVSPDDERTRLGKLSQREFELLCRIGRGQGIKECAVEMQVTGSTISTYRARLLEKLGLKTTTDLIRYAIVNGISSNRESQAR